MVQMSLGNKIFQGWWRLAGILRVNEDQLELHFIRQDTFYVHAGPLAGSYAFPGFCKTSQIGGKLHKNAVFLY